MGAGGEIGENFQLYGIYHCMCRLRHVPVSTDIGVVGDLVVVHSLLTLPHESVLLTVGPDAGCTHERLPEVRVDWGTSDRLQTLQLTRGSHIETLSEMQEG